MLGGGAVRWAANSPSWCSAKPSARGLLDAAHARPPGRDRRPVDGGDAAAGDRDARAGWPRIPEGRRPNASPTRSTTTQPARDHRRLRPHRPDRRRACCARRSIPVHRAGAQRRAGRLLRRFGNADLLRRPDPARTAARGGARAGRGLRARDGRPRSQRAHRAPGQAPVPAPEGVRARAQPPARVPADGPGRGGRSRDLRTRAW